VKKIIVLILIIALIGSAALLLKKRKQSVKDAPVPVSLSRQVKVVSAFDAPLQQTRPFLAKLRSVESAGISSKLSGRIEKLLVVEDQPVKKGDLLLMIDDLEIVAGIKALQATLAAQKKDVIYVKSLHDRNKSLFDVGGLAREKYEASEVAYATKQAVFEATRQQIVALEIQRDYLNIKAPFDGTVGTIFSRKGDFSSPGKPLLTLNSPGQKLIFSYVAKGFAIQKGQEVLINGKAIGQIKTLYSDAENGLLVAEVSVESPLQQPNNSYVSIEVITFAGSGCRVPVEALIQRKEGTQVMMYGKGEFSALSVSVIASNTEYALIEPCPATPVAVAAAARLSQLPGFGQVQVQGSDTHEE